MNLLYLLLLALSVMIFLDYKFHRTIVYALLFNLVIAFISLQAEPLSGAVLFSFGCIFFPLLMWFVVERCEKTEKEDMKDLVVISAMSIAALFIFLTSLNIVFDHVMLFLIFSFSMIALLTAKNMLKFLFIFDVAENTLVLTAYSFFPGGVMANVSAIIFIEIATFLPLVLLAYLTVHMFKKYRSLNPWHLWHLP